MSSNCFKVWCSNQAEFRIIGNGRVEENYANFIKKLISIAPKQPPYDSIDPVDATKRD